MMTPDSRHVMRRPRLAPLCDRHPAAAFRQAMLACLGKRRRICSAFTLIEMIIVIAIISVLLGLLYGALERAQKFSRRTITYSELKTIETAFKQYRAHYKTWPSTTDISSIVFTSTSPDGGNDEGFVIDRTVAALLQGASSTYNQTPITQDQITRFNPDLIPFMEFSRIAPASGFPVNPFKSNNASASDTTRAYLVLFDTTGDHQLRIPGNAPIPSGVSAPATNIIADVAVFTFIPGTRKTDSSGNPQTVQEVVFGSWQPFGVSD